jgi:hypothetical protein
MDFIQKNPAVLVAVVVVAVGLAGWSVWRAFAPSHSDPRATVKGRITPRSSILGPDQSGAPRQ